MLGGMVEVMRELSAMTAAVKPPRVAVPPHGRPEDAGLHRGVRHRGPGDPAHERAQHDARVREPSRHPSGEGGGEGEQAPGDPGRVHQMPGEHEEGHREQREALGRRDDALRADGDGEVRVGEEEGEARDPDREAERHPEEEEHEEDGGDEDHAGPSSPDAPPRCLGPGLSRPVAPPPPCGAGASLRRPPPPSGLPPCPTPTPTPALTLNPGPSLTLNPNPGPMPFAPALAVLVVAPGTAPRAAPDHRRDPAQRGQEQERRPERRRDGGEGEAQVRGHEPPGRAHEGELDPVPQEGGKERGDEAEVEQGHGLADRGREIARQHVDPDVRPGPHRLVRAEEREPREEELRDLDGPDDRPVERPGDRRHEDEEDEEGEEGPRDELLDAGQVAAGGGGDASHGEPGSGAGWSGRPERRRREGRGGGWRRRSGPPCALRSVRNEGRGEDAAAISLRHRPGRAPRSAPSSRRPPRSPRRRASCRRRR